MRREYAAPTTGREKNVVLLWSIVSCKNSLVVDFFDVCLVVFDLFTKFDRAKINRINRTKEIHLFSKPYMMAQQTENERVKIIVSVLRKEGKIKNDSEVATALGYSRSSISEILNGSAGVSRKFIDKLCAYYGVHDRYITEGKPPKFKSELIEQKQPTIAEPAARYLPAGERVFMTVPLVNQYAYAGYLSGWADVEYIDILPRVPFIVDKEYKGNYMCFEVRGDSMNDGSIDSYIAGDLALCREINRPHWQSKLHINQWDFIIIHKTEGILLKRIIAHDTVRGMIKLHSLNALYEDFEIALDDVAQLFNVVKIERKK